MTYRLKITLSVFNEHLLLQNVIRLMYRRFSGDGSIFSGAEGLLLFFSSLFALYLGLFFFFFFVIGAVIGMKTSGQLC